jgi:hypothetical protein
VLSPRGHQLASRQDHTQREGRCGGTRYRVLRLSRR